MTATTSHSAVLTLPDDTTIHVTREFAAPARQVWKAWTTPELIKRWWAGERGTVTIADVDLRVGGRWRYVMTANEGFEVAFHGEYREVVPTERLVHTEVYEGAPGGDEAGVLVTNIFEERDGRTLVTMITTTPTAEIRDLIVRSGMEDGMQEALDALEKVAVELG